MEIKIMNKLKLREIRSICKYSALQSNTPIMPSSCNHNILLIDWLQLMYSDNSHKKAQNLALIMLNQTLHKSFYTKEMPF